MYPDYSVNYLMFNIDQAAVEGTDFYALKKQNLMNLKNEF